VVNLLVFGCLEEGGVEDLLFDGRVHFQRVADFFREVELAFIVARLLELLEPLLDLAVVRLQQRDGVVAALSLSLRPCRFSSCHLTLRLGLDEEAQGARMPGRLASATSDHSRRKAGYQTRMTATRANLLTKLATGWRRCHTRRR
jgi:hypothetical protein